MVKRKGQEQSTSTVGKNKKKKSTSPVKKQSKGVVEKKSKGKEKTTKKKVIKGKKKKRSKKRIVFKQSLSEALLSLGNKLGQEQQEGDCDKTEGKNVNNSPFSKWYIRLTDKFLVFSPYGKLSPCQVVGVDIGSLHLALCGLALHTDNNEKNESPGPRWVCTWIALLSCPAKTLLESCDHITDVLSDNPEFHWLKDARIHGIEQQVQANAKARAIAAVVREHCRTWQKQRLQQENRGERRATTFPSMQQQQVDVRSVAGEKKYHVAPLYCPETLEDNIRVECDRGGQKNTWKRKILGRNDAVSLLQLNKERNMLTFFRLFQDKVDQLYDMTDAYLIARCCILDDQNQQG